MEKRIGALLIIIKDKDHIQSLNHILSEQSSIIIARQGIPLRDKEVSIISLVVEGLTEEINSLSGKLGKIKGISVKTVFAKD